MLPSDLLQHRRRGETLEPAFIHLDPGAIALAQTYLDCFGQCVGKTQGHLEEQLRELEGDTPDYRLRRGLAHILRSSFSTFEIVSPLDPVRLRQRVFSLAAADMPLPENRDRTLAKIAEELSQEGERTVVAAEVRAGLYADLQANRILTTFDPPTAEALIHRYNLSQVQGIFYKASQVTIHAHRNDPGEYKFLFRYLKLFQLMAYIEGDMDTGFTIALDGPVSLFKASTRYGLALAKMLPALLHVTRWSLESTLEYRDPYSGDRRQGRFAIDSQSHKLVSHYPPGKPYDSMLEESFATRWGKLKTDWQLEREVSLIPIPGSVMIPDFRLVHPDGRDFLLEIVGYWRPEYLQKKFSQVRRAQCPNLILAISERLNLAKANVNLDRLPARIVWFKDKLLPKAVLSVLESD